MAADVWQRVRGGKGVGAATTEKWDWRRRAGGGVGQWAGERKATGGEEKGQKRKVNRGRLGRKGDSHRYDYIERRGGERDGWETAMGEGGGGGMESGLKGSSNTLHSPAQQMPHSVWHSDLWACLYLYPHCVTPGPAQGLRHTNSYLGSRLPQLGRGQGTVSLFDGVHEWMLHVFTRIKRFEVHLRWADQASVPLKSLNLSIVYVEASLKVGPAFPALYALVLFAFFPRTKTNNHLDARRPWTFPPACSHRSAPAHRLTAEGIEMWTLLFINASLAFGWHNRPWERSAANKQEADLAAGGLGPLTLPRLLEKKQLRVSLALHLELHGLQKKTLGVKNWKGWRANGGERRNNEPDNVDV